VNSILELSFLLIIILIISFKSGVFFSDVDNYVEMYSNSVVGREVNAELSFVFLSKISDFFGASYFGLFFLYASISIISKKIFLKEFFNNPISGFLLYFVSYFILYEFVQMRAGASIGIFLLSVLFYNKRLYFKSFLFSILAISLHLSAIPLVILLYASSLFFHKSPFDPDYRLSVLGLCLYVLSFVFMLFHVFLIILPVIDLRSILFEVTHGLLHLFLPSRLYEGYIIKLQIADKSFSMKEVLSLIFSFICICFSFSNMMSKNWIYRFSNYMVVFSFWVYFFFGFLGLAAERLAELLILFMIIVVDGVIKKNKYLGWGLYISLIVVFLCNIIFRAAYFKFL